MSEVDWLSHLLRIISVTGQLEVRCACRLAVNCENVVVLGMLCS